MVSPGRYRNDPPCFPPLFPELELQYCQTQGLTHDGLCLIPVGVSPVLKGCDEMPSILKRHQSKGSRQ